MVTVLILSLIKQKKNEIALMEINQRMLVVLIDLYIINYYIINI